MKTVTVTDEHGLRRIYKIRDNDREEDAAEIGIPYGPDVNEIDWNAVKRDLNNRLIDMQLFDWSDVVKQQHSLTNISKSVLKKHLVDLYRKETRL